MFRFHKDSYVSFSDNIALAAGKSFDYETLNYYRLALYVTDSMATSGPYYLNIHVLDDPEVCKFPQNLYRYDTFEAGVSNVLELFLEEGSYCSKIYFIF